MVTAWDTHSAELHSSYAGNTNSATQSLAQVPLLLQMLCMLLTVCPAAATCTLAVTCLPRHAVVRLNMQAMLRSGIGGDPRQFL